MQRAEPHPRRYYIGEIVIAAGFTVDQVIASIGDPGLGGTVRLADNVVVKIWLNDVLQSGPHAAAVGVDDTWTISQGIINTLAVGCYDVKVTANNVTHTEEDAIIIQSFDDTFDDTFK